MYSTAFLTAAVLVAQVNALAVPGSNTAISTPAKRADRYSNWPTYDELPLDPSYPTKAAWGVWGANDSLGALNHITAATILAAASQIRTGRAFNLNLDLNKFLTPLNTNRKASQHYFQPGTGYTDDVIMINTQVTTQYDGLRHFPYSTEGNISTYQWYNDLISDYDEVIGPGPSTPLGIQEASQYGIAGRGVLLDFARWAENQSLNYSAFEYYPITVETLDAVAEWQGLPSNWSLPGDMLFIRTGWIQQYNNLTILEREILPWSGLGGASIGMEASDESLEWIWDKKLALVGGDNPAFETLPFNSTISGDSRSMHEVFIAGWGQSIVEYLDMEELSLALHQQGRSTFFITIQVLNILSGIASTANAMAIM